MKRFGTVLIALGLVAVVVACFPKLAGTESPEPGFGPQQTTAAIVGVVLVVIGLVMCACGKCKCLCAAGAGDEPEEDSAEAPEAAEEASSE
jgi:hypothetical protein